MPGAADTCSQQSNVPYSYGNAKKLHADDEQAAGTENHADRHRDFGGGKSCMRDWCYSSPPTHFLTLQFAFIRHDIVYGAHFAFDYVQKPAIR